MTLRTLAAPAALAVLLSLWGCAGLSGTSKQPTEQDPLAAGNAAFEQKDYARACQQLSQAGGGGAETLYRTGFACAQDGKAKAERAYKAALATDPKYAAALEALGLEAYAAGDLAQAGSLLETAAKVGGKNPRAALALGEIYLLSGRCEPAQASFQEAARRDPGLVAAKARLTVMKAFCGARKSVPHSASPAVSSGSAAGHATPASGGLSGAAPVAGTKESPKAKPASKTIDLNDI